MRKVVVTGLGVLAPNGNNVNSFWSALIAGQSGIGPISYFDTDDLRVSIAGELSNFTPEPVLTPKEVRKLDPFSVYALVAGQEAIDQSGLDLTSIDLDRAGVIIGSGVGGIQTLEDQHGIIMNKGGRRVSPQFVPKNDIQYCWRSFIHSMGVSRSKSNYRISLRICDRCDWYGSQAHSLWRC